ncbi:MAG: choice-of-anchor P family protein [Gemmatimonadota bacterium]
MKIDSIGRVIRVAAFTLPLIWLPGSALGQMQRTATAQAFGVSVNTASVNQTTPSAVAPADGGMTQNDAGEVSIASLVTAQNAYAVASGWADEGYSDAVSTASLGSVNILNGLITTTGVVAIATSTAEGSDAYGSSLANLVVNGVSMSAPEPNTRVDLPGVGYVVLNEQIATASGITVNMIHVVLQQVGLLGTQTLGNIIVGSASSSVN